MNQRPPFGTAPIRCGKARCKWRGFETDLVGRPGKHGLTYKVCPTCGCDSYSFMTAKEIAAWKPVGVQACRPEDRAMLATPEGAEMLAKAVAAISHEPPNVAIKPRRQASA